jgi:hypothetical protein
MEELKKICSKCKVDKLVEEYHLVANSDKRRTICRDCVAERFRNWKSKNTEAVRNKWRIASRKYSRKPGYADTRKLKKYNLTLEQHTEMYDRQNGVCSICGSDRTLVIDHCHKTNKVRELICNSCNLGLGSFKDNPNLLLIAAEYLKKYSGVE